MVEGGVIIAGGGTNAATRNYNGGEIALLRDYENKRRIFWTIGWDIRFA